MSARPSGNAGAVEQHRRTDDARAAAAAQRSTSQVAARRVVAGLVGVWLVASPWVLPGPSDLVVVKDVAAGVVLMVVAAAATVDRRARRIEAPVCFALGVLLIAASVALEFGSGDLAAASQWNEVVIGVLLVYLATAGSRAGARG